MRLAEVTLPKINPAECGREGNSGGLIFCPIEEGVERAQSRFGGKTLFVSDTHSFGCFTPFARNLRAISVVFEADVLPLFSMPDGVGSVFAAGGEEALKAARFFAKVRRVPCVLFPAEGSMRGVVEDTDEILLCGQRTRTTLAEGEVIVDLSLLGDSFAETFASLLLARLALIEEHALRIFSRAEKPAFFEKMFLLTEPDCRNARELIERNYAIRKAVNAGVPAGEAETLVRLHKAAGDSFPVWRAFCELLALYTAFFECGKPRKFYVPDYSARAKSAKANYWRITVPSPEEYEYRAAMLERMRVPFSAELNTLLKRREQFVRAFSALAGIQPPQTDFRRLKSLPEHCPNGLSALIRDFGLMEL